MPRISIVASSESEELDPMQLLWDCDLDRASFAELFGVAKQTVDTWCAGIYKPSRQCRRLAAEIKKRWQREGKL